MNTPLIQADIPGMTPRRGKVRDLFDFGDRLLIVATDRLSAFDWILPTPIPDKGRILTQLSAFWFQRLGVRHHLVSLDPGAVDLPAGTDVKSLAGRSMVVRKGEVVPFECVVRGYLAGSGWKDYLRTQSVCGIPLPAGLAESQILPQPLFTPATKAESGHDENVSKNSLVETLGKERADELELLSIKIYLAGRDHAAKCGIILADTKFEFGLIDGQVHLVDEVLTPDSSRYWPQDEYQPGGSPPSFDKQFVRDWLEKSGWDKNSPPPPLPEEIVVRTRERYLQAFSRLTGSSLD